MHISKKAKKLILSPMRKFHPYNMAAKARGVKIYCLNIGQPDIATPQIAFDAVAKFDSNILSYAPSPGIPSLIDGICDYYGKINVNISADDVLVTTGGSEALQFVCNCILDDGDEVIIPEPFYPNYSTFVHAAGGEICPLETCPEDGYFYADRAKIEARINDRTRAIIITNPGNPTGVALNKEQVEMFLDIAKQHDLYLIADEVYREFNYSDTPLVSFGEYPEYGDNVVLIDSVSKRFSACGARIGAVICRNKELMNEVLKFCQSRLSVASLEQTAATAMYTLGAEYFDEIRKEYQLRRDTVVGKLKEIPGVVTTTPDGAFYTMAALPVDDADAFQIWLLTEFTDNGETVMFAPGAGFYETKGKGKNEIRIAYVLQQSRLERAMDLLKLGIEAYQNR
ncbi:MAG: pyridoxal phosphate-dependent aminotransferase [Eubacteriales bacterium]